MTHRPKGKEKKKTSSRYLSRCRTLLPILLAAAATMDSVIPVGNHDSGDYRRETIFFFERDFRHDKKSIPVPTTTTSYSVGRSSSMVASPPAIASELIGRTGARNLANEL